MTIRKKEKERTMERCYTIVVENATWIDVWESELPNCEFEVLAVALRCRYED